jgi:hypothetical protein
LRDKTVIKDPHGPNHSKHIRASDNKIVDYIWNFKTHYINKTTLYRPKRKGGLALPNPILIKTKNILNRLKSLGNTPQTPWEALYIFWLGFGMRNKHDIYTDNKLVKKLDTPSQYRGIK